MSQEREETFTCVSCKHKNLTYREIVYQEDKNNEILLFTVQCIPCFLKSSEFQKVAKQTPEAQKILKQLIKRLEYNYDRKTLRRVLRKKA